MPDIRTERRDIHTRPRGGRRSSDGSSFVRWLDFNLAIARGQGTTLGVFCIRIDRKEVSAACQQTENLEQFLVDFQGKLARVSPTPGRVRRLWDNGFAMAQPFLQGPFDAYLHARKLLERLERIIQNNSDTAKVKLSMGVALYPEDGNSATLLLERAFDAAGRARLTGAHCFCFYSRATGRKMAKILATDVGLARALKSDSVEMHIQPVLDLHTLRFDGVLGEPFWRHPTEGELLFEDIDRSVERSGLSAVYDRWFRETLRSRLETWSRRSGNHRVGIRLGRSQLLSSEPAADLHQLLETKGIAAERLEFVVDGRCFLGETDHRRCTTLWQLAELGARMTMANVGDGPLPIDSLTTLPFEGVELAPSAISSACRGVASKRKFSALFGLVRTLGLRSRAIGVTSDEQLTLLREHDCDEAAGPLLAPSIRPAELDRFPDMNLLFDYSTASPRLLPLH